MTEVMPEDPVIDRSSTCHECSTDLPNDWERVGPVHEYVGGTEGWTNVYYCGDCRETCQRCGTIEHPDYVQYVEETGLYLCSGCHATCYQCGETVDRNARGAYSDRLGDWYCTEHRVNEDDRIRGYGHTRGEIWLRMPDEPSRRADPDRYYMGWELEIGTNVMTAKHVRDWAEEHIGNRDAIVCKEDSSVHGFEIVSQPMTPAYFESLNWESFFEMLDEHHPLTGIGHYDTEPDDHGLHVHIGRVAFGKDDIMIAAYAYLLSQSDQLERIGRRRPTSYCNKVQNPVKVVIAGSEKADVQARRIKAMGIYPGRDAINLTNDQTIEIRAYKSTRNAAEFRAAVRTTYVAAEYVRSLRESRMGLGGKALHWDTFMEWVKVNYPDAYSVMKK